jgi:hypothetical protein
MVESLDHRFHTWYKWRGETLNAWGCRDERSMRLYGMGQRRVVTNRSVSVVTEPWRFRVMYDEYKYLDTITSLHTDGDFTRY